MLVAFDVSAFVRYITRFTEESFAALVSFIFIWEAFKKAFTTPEMPARVPLESYSPLRAANASVAGAAAPVFFDNYTGDLVETVSLVNQTERIFTECRCLPIDVMRVATREDSVENVTYVERNPFWELIRNRSNWTARAEQIDLYNCSTSALVGAHTCDCMYCTACCSLRAYRKKKTYMRWLIALH